MLDNAASDLPSLELQESIDELAAYREKLFQDVVGLGNALITEEDCATVAAYPEPKTRRGDVTAGC